MKSIPAPITALTGLNVGAARPVWLPHGNQSGGYQPCICTGPDAHRIAPETCAGVLRDPVRR